ncbi:hypothetical protein CVO96_05205 [Deinococcus koreensis]|uniref:Uncharacterized protein n=1 Tax=Deinococcus koreensis TaxID=2054903 RepID=A0A2K3UWD3_9DEIO|nr:hypothetical protein CVO96_05205 [Deinococcus koreensis]
MDRAPEAGRRAGLRASGRGIVMGRALHPDSRQTSSGTHEMPALLAARWMAAAVQGYSRLRWIPGPEVAGHSQQLPHALQGQPPAAPTPAAARPFFR